ncbi:hypothetical protein [Natronorubrum halophilum]|uniref:hypothetical protein n=1 Tax=Natronorubrum halophilum TaxID=1702106 RepID=UPI000EF6E00F|nr:hypothetical protein [Natronorubrum halophilum]
MGRNLPTRRSVLRTAAAGTAVVGLGLGVTGSVAASDEYGTVVNLVDDFGADPTGEEPIDDVLDEAVQNDTKVIFPEGEYYLEEGGFHRNGAGTAASFDPDGTPEEYVFDVALVGQGDVTLRPAEGVETFVLALWGDGVRVENFRIDQTAAETNVGMSYLVQNDLVVRDIVYEGLADTWGTVKIGPGIVEPDGTGLIENFHVPDGSMGYGRETGAWVFPDHAGDLLFKRCSFKGLADNAIYASGPGGNGNGSVGVENCYFENNNVSSIRLGTPGSYAKNCTVVLDGYIPEYDTWGAVTARAVWLWSEFGGELRNIDVRCNHESSYGVLDYAGHDGAVAMRNCRFEMNADGNQAVDLTNGTADIAMKNTSITGDASGGTALELTDSAVAIQNLCLAQSGADRDGVTLENATGTIRNARIDVTGEQVVTDGDSDVAVTNLSEHGDCPPAQARHPLQNRF